MANVNYLLYESAVGFSLFEVVHQADAVGLELPEVKDAMKSLDKFGKMIQLRSFNPWTYVLFHSCTRCFRPNLGRLALPPMVWRPST